MRPETARKAPQHVRRVASGAREATPVVAQLGGRAVEDAAPPVEGALERGREPAEDLRLYAEPQPIREIGRYLAMGGDVGPHLDRHRDRCVEPLEPDDVEYPSPHHQADPVAHVKCAPRAGDRVLLQADGLFGLATPSPDLQRIGTRHQRAR